jgi:hypothetical protein
VLVGVLRFVRRLHEIIFKVDIAMPLVENQKCRWKKQ